MWPGPFIPPSPLPQDYETYRNTVGILHDTWAEAAGELDQCRLKQRQAQEDERRKEAEARAHRAAQDRGYYGRGRGRGGGGPYGDEYYPSGSDDDDDDDDTGPFNFFSGGSCWGPVVVIGVVVWRHYCCRCCRSC